MGPPMPDSINRPLRVFLCHSSHDKPLVRELYQKLRAETWIQPWLDEEELYPGQDWDVEIEKAVERTDAVIVFLSKNSINKEGYVQAELRYVLDIARTKPEETIFVIPFKLEDCQVPRRLMIYQYVDYFLEAQRERTFARLLKSLKMRADSLGLKTEPPEPKKESKSPEKPVEEKKLVAENPKPAPKTESKPPEKPVEEKKPIVETSKPAPEIESKPPEKPIAEKKSAVETSKPAPKIESVLSEKPIEEKKSVVETFKPTLKLESKPPEKIVEKNKPAIEKPNPAQEIVHQPVKPSSITSNKLVLGGMEFMCVPAGKFLMGSTKENTLADDDEQPQHSVDIPYDYWMARFPTTNEHYNKYVAANGLKHPVTDWMLKKDHPVVNISWNDVMAYCQWLNDFLKGELSSGLVLRLPTEAEWEKAARWNPSPIGRGSRSTPKAIRGEGYEWPWGSEFDKNRCNSGEGGKGMTTVVGSYSPRGDSPYGCADMAGNVWEWTHSLYKSYPYQAKDGREDKKSLDFRVLRGGAFACNVRLVRCACRFRLGLRPDTRGNGGLRIVVAPLISLPSGS